ncbi:polysaccharide deacetylase [Clostridium polyendosporum]|uniref:Polysaccharide deacetylase n=1 Tax=Clostridium polyendosporum TaxID=69208 RepID=A0A919RW11_9CLOT|nr:polysaccharide deacetylase family protein [Clostridium polyendosporum]GIM27441.1 polysaccharide deacetylase [Clostridium polyendosporum]
MQVIKKTFLLILIFIFIIPQYKCFSLTEEARTEKIVYLTFDDGPSEIITREILDILKEYNVNATFFLIGKMIKGQEQDLRRMVDEGHSLGLHTYSHERNKIYRSNQSFIDEMILTQQIIYEVTGFKTNILRFPFGSNNGSYKLSASMVNNLHNSELKIYDWNVDSTDGLNPKIEPSMIAKRAQSIKNPAVILLHCGAVNKNTVKALPSIIEYYKKNDYKFKVITSETPEVYRIRRK